MDRSNIRGCLAALTLGLAGAESAAAAVVLDQEQPVLSSLSERGYTAIGSDAEQKLAQTVRAAQTGLMVRVDLPVACVGTGSLVLSITEVTPAGLPGGRDLGTTLVPATSLFGTSPPTFRQIHLTAPVSVMAGAQFAIVLDIAGAECSLLRGPDGDSYSRGEGFFDARPNPPGWLRFSATPDPVDDLAFKTWVDVPSGGGSAGFCTLPTGPLHLGGPGPVILPFPIWLPICRCIEDPGLRSERCGLLLPEIFLFREVPRPIPPGLQFEVRWVVVPLVDGARAPVVLETLPKGFAAERERKIDFGEDLRAFEPVERRFPLVAGEEVDLEGWLIDYIWPEQ